LARRGHDYISLWPSKPTMGSSLQHNFNNFVMGIGRRHRF
jgi:hypothetical protein